MIEPVFSNAICWAIEDVTGGTRPASILDDKVALHQAALRRDYEDGAQSRDFPFVDENLFNEDFETSHAY